MRSHFKTLYEYWSLVIAGTLLLTGSGVSWGQTTRFLFLDPALIQHSEKAELHVNPPDRREIVIRPDQPWEKLMISFFLSVMEDEGKLRMWYICRDADNQPNLAYAESKDGIHWEKPNLRIVDYHGSRDNNLVGISSLEGVVFRDPKAQSPNEKYVYVTHVVKKGVFRFASADGLHWQSDSLPLLPFRVDTQTVTFWDENHQCYVLYLRGWDPAPGWDWRLRTVVRLTTDDLSKPIVIVASGKGDNPSRSDDLPRIVNEIPTALTADQQDPPNTDVYNISAQPYPLDPHWYVGFPSFFHREKNISDGQLDVEFVGGSDGVAWHRYDRRPYVRHGPADSESANMVFMGTGMVIRGDEIWQYGTGFRSRHGDVDARKRQTDGIIYRYVQRVDGFVSLDFNATEGKCTTVPVKVEGSSLLLNVNTGDHGLLRVALLDADGKPIPGFSADECDPVQINSTHAVVSWKGRHDLASLRGQSVQLALRGSDTKLYSFLFD